MPTNSNTIVTFCKVKNQKLLICFHNKIIIPTKAMNEKFNSTNRKKKCKIIMSPFMQGTKSDPKLTLDAGQF